MELEEVKHRTIRGIVALTGRTIFLQSISLVASFLLALFLSPSDLGTFVKISALLRIFALFTDLGLGAALLQKKEDLDEDDIKTVFTIQEIIVILVVLVGFALTPVMVRQFHFSQNEVFLYLVLVFNLFLSSLKVIPSILLERKLAFEKQIIPQIVEQLVFNAIVVYLAYRNFGVAAYSWGFLISSLVGLPIYYLVSPWKIGIGYYRERAKHLFSYGIKYQGKNILAVVKDDLLTFFLSNVVGDSGVGYWGWAQKYAYSPLRLVVDSVTKVTFPAYSRAQDDQKALRSGIERSLFVISLILFPLLTMIAILMNNFIHLIPRLIKWEPAIPSLYFLCATAALSALSNILVNVLDATGNVKTTLYLMILWIITIWLSTLFLVSRFGFTGISIAQFLVASTIVITIYLTRKVVNFDFLGNVGRQIVASVIMGIGMGIVSQRIPNSFITLGFLAIIGVSLYSTIIWLTAKNKIIENGRIILKAYGR